MEVFKVPCWFDTTTNFYITVEAKNALDAISIVRKMLVSSDPDIHNIIDHAIENNITAIETQEIAVVLDEFCVEVANNDHENDMS